MKTSRTLAVSDIHNFARSIAAINNGKNIETEVAKQECKEAIRVLYDFGSQNFHDGMVWNWGCIDEEVDSRIRRSIPLYDAALTDGFSEQLYCLALHSVGVELSEKNVLDVGCGFGEGLNFASRVFGFHSAVGLDLCQGAIDRANARLARQGVLYMCGDAENLPFDDGQMDVIINVESSHTYPDLPRFLKEVERVLRPGGYFSHLDLFTEERYSQFKAQKAEVALDWISETDITDRVKRAIHARVKKGSFLRTSLAKQQSGRPLFRMLTEPFVLANYGADFAGYRYTASERLVRRVFARVLQRSGALEPVRFTRYLHHVARKA